MKLRTLLLYLQLLTANEWQKADLYRKYLGIKIVKNVRITHFTRWGSEPYLIEISDNVTITRGVSFYTHDGGVGLFRNQYPNINVFGKIRVVNNVFIGANSMILHGVTIGNNVIIGAGSIVTKDIPDDVVAVGVPARVIKSVDEYKNKILKKVIKVVSKKHDKRKNEIISKRQ